MDPVVLAVGLGLVLMIAYLVGYPLVRPEPPTEDLEWELDEEVDSRERAREAVFTTLGEIEFDYRMGKLTEEDYRALTNQYKKQAVDIQQAEEAEVAPPREEESGGLTPEEEAAIEREIEEELARLRRQRQAKQE